MVITSLENNQVKLWTKLQMKKYRDLYHFFLVEEKHLIQEAIKANVLETLIIREGVKNEFIKEPILVSEAVMKKISTHVSLNDYVGICRIKEKDINSFNSLIVLENIQDPGNMGTIIRTAYCLGYDGLLISNDCVDIYNEKVIASSQGAIFRLPIIRKDIKEIYQVLKNNNVKLYATSLQDAQELSTIVPSNKYALVMGNEGNGLSKYCKDNADLKIKIEMSNFDSLNVAVATGICAYYFKNK